MPPAPSRKGAKSGGAREQPSSSRHSTPVSSLTDASAPPTPVMATPSDAATMPRETAYLHTPTAALVSQDPSIETLIQGRSAAKPGDPPSARDLLALHDSIQDTVNKIMGKRSEVSDRSLRQLMQKRKERIHSQQEEEIARQQDEAARFKREDEDTDRKKVRKPGGKRNHDEMDLDHDEDVPQESLPTVGAHGPARQDGVGVHEGVPAPPSPPIQPGTVMIDPMDVAQSPSNSDESRKDAPSTIPLYERIFGPDPTKFDDPTVYDVRPLRDDMGYEEKREIVDVLHWPESDLRHLTAGDPPDQDFSNAKPANQVNFSTFQTAIEPYIRLFTEEDVATLKERGDRVTPYVIPALGPKGYRDVWAAEDGLTGIEPPAIPKLNPNEARGSMDNIDDNVAETDEVSMGPVMSRLLSIVRPTTSNARRDEDSTDTNGDISMFNDDPEMDGQALAGASEDPHQRPFTYLPADAPRPPTLPQLDYESLDQRMLQELRYIGFLGADDIPDYDAQNDDEVCARLRTLQHELRRIASLNNARKLRVLALTEERMAMQEYANIADDLDNQVNAAYLKRNRSMAKPNNKKGGQHRAGQKGVAGGVGGGRGVSDGVRALMQKRRDWVDMVGPVVEYGKPRIPEEDETIFGDEVMKTLREAELEAELAEAEGE